MSAYGSCPLAEAQLYDLIYCIKMSIFQIVEEDGSLLEIGMFYFFIIFFS